MLAGLCDPLDPTTPPDRIIVVDDDSSDRTAALAAAHDGVEVVPAPPLPESWTGKSWACHSGLQQVPQRSAEHGGPDDVVVFLDADVRLTRAALARVVAERDEHGGLVSVQPWHETERPYEQLSCLFNVLAVMGTAMGSRGGATGAFGPVLVTSRADYEAVGGHGSVRSEVVEDLALAQRYRDAGLPVEVVEGRRDIRFRMYPGGLRQLTEGWTKNFAGVALYLAFATQLWVMFRQVGRFGPVTALLFPVPLVFFIAVFVRSLWRTHVRHSVTWRGRAVSTLVDRR